MYRHGIYVSEQETSMIAPLNGTAGLQVVIGTAPVHLLGHRYLCIQYLAQAPQKIPR